MSSSSKSRVNTGPNVLFATDKGMCRSNNEDYGGYYIPPDQHVREQLGCLFAVSDGVGSQNAGEVASSEAVNVLLQEYYFGSYTDKVPERFKQAFNVTSLHVYDLAEQAGSCNKMMCTLTSLLIKENKFYISHVGDSKIFLLHDGAFIQLSKDHSVVGRLLRTGFITKEEAKVHPQRHVILRSLGERPILPADFYSGNAMPGDIFFMCTDGILGHLDENEIRDFLLDKRHLEEGAAKLVAVANERGGEDNLTAMIIDV